MLIFVLRHSVLIKPSTFNWLMPKKFGILESMKGRKLAIFGRISLNFEFKNVVFSLYRSGTVRHSMNTRNSLTFVI